MSLNSKCKIIIIGANYYGEMASSSRVRNLFKAFDDNLFDIDNVLVNEKETINTDKLVKSKHLGYKLKKPLTIIHYHRKIKQILSSVKSDRKIIFHYGYPSIETYYLLQKAKKYGFKICFDIVENIEHFDNRNRSFKNKIKNYTSKFLFNKIDVYADICFGISTKLVEFINESTNKQIKVKHLPISVDIQLIQSFKKFNNENQIIKVFYGGSFGFKDGFPILLKGFELACEDTKDIKLILTGKISNQMKGVIENLIENSKFKNQIDYLGCVENNEYFSLMANSDILCMPRVNSEFANYGFPFKLGEYLASGNAIITTNVGDVSLYIENQKNALLISPESENEIYNSIKLLKENKELRKQIGINAQKTAETYFSHNDITKKLISYFEELF